MNQIMPIKLAKTYQKAYTKYGWSYGVEGFCVDYNTLTIAEMAQKEVEFNIKRRRIKYVINPTRAKEVAKEWGSFFTRSRDRKVVVVIPQSECREVKYAE